MSWTEAEVIATMSMRESLQLRYLGGEVKYRSARPATTLKRSGTIDSQIIQCQRLSTNPLD